MPSIVGPACRSRCARRSMPSSNAKRRRCRVRCPPASCASAIYTAQRVLICALIAPPFVSAGLTGPVRPGAAIPPAPVRCRRRLARRGQTAKRGQDPLRHGRSPGFVHEADGCVRASGRPAKSAASAFVLEALGEGHHSPGTHAANGTVDAVSGASAARAGMEAEIPGLPDRARSGHRDLGQLKRASVATPLAIPSGNTAPKGPAIDLAMSLVRTTSLRLRSLLRGPLRFLLSGRLAGGVLHRHFPRGLRVGNLLRERVFYNPAQRLTLPAPTRHQAARRPRRVAQFAQPIAQDSRRSRSWP